MGPFQIGKRQPASGHLPPISQSDVMTTKTLNTEQISKEQNPQQQGLKELVASNTAKNSHSDGCFGLQICKECYQQLLNTFEHCLKTNLVTTHEDFSACSNASLTHSNSNANLKTNMKLSKTATDAAQGMLSIMEMDEMEDGKQLTESPDFNLVHDTSTQTERATNKMMLVGKKQGNSGQEIVHGVPLSPTADILSKANPKPSPNTSKNLDQQTFGSFEAMENKLMTGSGFSGQLYKAVLQHKNQEIKKLKEILYNKSLNEKLEQGNVSKLQKALGKAVGFYSFAQDWKDQEVRRLQHDIVILKTYLSTLMACIIQAELEKQKVLVDVQSKIEQVEKKDAVIKEERMKFLEMQETLQTTYREYVQLNKEHEELLQNSTNSRELNLIKQKLDTMTQQYKAVSEDFMTMTKDYDAKVLKCKQLEFELSEFVRQFNQIGEEKQKIAEDLKILQNKHQSTLNTVQEAKDAHRKTILERNQLEIDLRNLSNLHEQFKSTSQKESERTMSIIQYEKEKYSKLTIEHDVTTKELVDARTEIEKLNKDHAHFVQDAHKIESLLKSAITDRDTKLAAITSTLEDTERELKRTQEQRDTLMMKSNQLRVDLDAEVSQHRSATLDFKLYKQENEEKITNLTREVNALSSAKDSLVAEGRQLMEDIRQLRMNLLNREQDIQNLDIQLEDERKKWEIKEDQYVSEKEDLKEQCSLLQDQLSRLRQDLGKAQENVTRFKAQSGVLDHDLIIMTEKYEKTQAALDSLKHVHDKLTITQQETLAKLKETSESLEKTSGTLKTLQHNSRISKLDNDEVTRAQKLRIKELEISYRSTSDCLQSTEDELRQLKESYQKLRRELDRIIVLYEEEKKMKERTEGYLNMAYDDLMSERKMRIEIENLMFRRQEAIKLLERKEKKMSRAQEEKRALLQKRLKEEHERLISFMQTVSIPIGDPTIAT